VQPTPSKSKSGYERPVGFPQPADRPYYFFLLLVDWFTVVFGLRATVDCLTKRPVIALRPRLPGIVTPPGSGAK
jgi:hypothetical protein